MAGFGNITSRRLRFGPESLGRVPGTFWGGEALHEGAGTGCTVPEKVFDIVAYKRLRNEFVSNIVLSPFWILPEFSFFFLDTNLRAS